MPLFKRPAPLDVAATAVGGPMAGAAQLASPLLPGVPAQARWLLQSLLGAKRFTEADLTPEELDALQRAATASMERQAAGSPQKGIQYRDYQRALGLTRNPAESVKSWRALQPSNAVPLSIGRANLVRGEEDGPDRVTDTYDFVNSARAGDVAQYDALKAQGYLPVLAQILRSAAAQPSVERAVMALPGELGEAFLGTGPQVDIALPKKLPTLKRAGRSAN